MGEYPKSQQYGEEYFDTDRIRLPHTNIKQTNVRLLLPVEIIYLFN